MTLSFSQLGKLGRIGNQFWQAASTIGIALKNGLDPVFPPWEYDRYLQTPLPHGQMNVPRVSEQGFRYQDIKVNVGEDLFGFFQSKKYWEEHEAEVLKQFEFRKDFEGYFKTRSLYARVFEKEVVAVHIRRGDYVNNENYYNLPPEYYTDAIKKFFPDKNRFNILVFSDDSQYAMQVLPPSGNVTHSIGNSDIDDLCMMSQCSNWIVANSSFSWWGAYLGSKNHGGTVVRPVHHFDGPLKETHDISDLYPEEWIAFDHEVKEDKKSVEQQVTELAQKMDVDAKKLSGLVYHTYTPTDIDGYQVSSSEIDAKAIEEIELKEPFPENVVNNKVSSKETIKETPVKKEMVEKKTEAKKPTKKTATKKK